MIMVGAGTGMAPFRGFLQERAALGEGCPRRIVDPLLRRPAREGRHAYPDELRAFEESGITKLQIAFSREPGQPRKFVQHARTDGSGSTAEEWLAGLREDDR
jgi:cytochrome P450 / NADPH-cytochrome P450 reductase